jgi:hypothetical protein
LGDKELLDEVISKFDDRLSIMPGNVLASFDSKRVVLPDTIPYQMPKVGEMIVYVASGGWG